MIWIAVAALFSLLASIGRAECAEPARKPVLMLFTANIDPATGKSWCAPCNRFKADWDADRDNLKTELQSAFRLEVHYVLQEDPRRPAVPSFKAALPGFAPIVGYTTPDDLLQRLGIRQPDQPRATPGDGQVVREGGSAGEDDLRHLEALQQSVREHRAAINAINDWINGDATGEELDSLRREGASLQRRLVALEEFLSETPWATEVD